MTFLNVIICIENKLALNYTKDFKLFERQNEKCTKKGTHELLVNEPQAFIKFILTGSMNQWNHSTVLS